MTMLPPRRATPFGVVVATPSPDPVAELSEQPSSGARSSVARVVPGLGVPPLSRVAVSADSVDPVTSMLTWAVPDLAADIRLNGSPLEDGPWNELVDFVEADRVVGLLWLAIENGMPVSVSQRMVAASMAHDALVNSVELDAVARWSVQVLADHGIDARIIKGLATAYAVHVVRERRDTGDVDLLVDPADFAKAREVLLSAGLAIDVRWGPGAVHFTKEEVFLTASGVEIDLHQSLSYGQRWRRMTSRLMEDGLPLDPSGEVRTLNIESLLISAAISARGSDGRMSGLLDVAAISRDPRLDSARLVDLLASTGIGPLIAPVFARAARWFLVDPAVVDLVNRAQAGRVAGLACRLESSESGARFLYSCLTGPPRTWRPGLSALFFPDDEHFGSDENPVTGTRRIARQLAAVARPSTWR